MATLLSDASTNVEKQIFEIYDIFGTDMTIIMA